MSPLRDNLFPMRRKKLTPDPYRVVSSATDRVSRKRLSCNIIVSEAFSDNQYDNLSMRFCNVSVFVSIDNKAIEAVTNSAKPISTRLFITTLQED